MANRFVKRATKTARKPNRPTFNQPDPETLFVVPDGQTNVSPAPKAPAPNAAAPDNAIRNAQWIDPERIEADAHQPRRFAMNYDQSAEHEELVETIREHGILQPLLVRPLKLDKNGLPRAYKLVAGERRLRAARTLGMNRVPVLVRDMTPREALEIQTIENAARVDLDERQLAQAYLRLAKEFGYTQQRIAERTGKSQGEISRLLKVFRDPVLKGFLEDETITYAQARELVSVKDEEIRRDLANEISRLSQGQEPVGLLTVRRAARLGTPKALSQPVTVTTEIADTVNESARGNALQLVGSTPTVHTPAERGERILKDLKLANGIWTGAAAQMEKEGARIGSELARNIRYEMGRMSAQLERMSAVVGTEEVLKSA